MIWSNDDESEPKYSRFAIRCAKLLWKEVKQKHSRKVKWHRSSVQEWAIHFDRLLKDGRSKKDVKIVLIDHIANMSNPYQPAAYSGVKFRENYERIADAMDRRKAKAQEKGRRLDPDAPSGFNNQLSEEDKL